MAKILTKTGYCNMKKMELAGVYMSWQGSLELVVKNKQQIGLFIWDGSDKYEELMAEVQAIGYFRSPNRGFWTGSDLAKILKAHGCKVYNLKLNTYYSMKELKIGPSKQKNSECKKEIRGTSSLGGLR